MKDDSKDIVTAPGATSRVYGKSAPPVGVWPSIVLMNPKYPHNVGQIVRAASCYGVKQVWWTGHRVSLDVAKGERLPREERMKGYKDVEMFQHDYPFDQFPKAVPVAIEIRPNCENLMDFVHPKNAVYVFGPEDGSLDKMVARHCHRFVKIPTVHCTNLAAAVWTVLYDRKWKEYMNWPNAVE